MHRFSNWLGALALVAALPAAAQIAAPADWRKESFDFPLRFAPKVAFEGKEHVRFMPGWDKFGDDTGFSYVVLWDVKTKPVTGEDLEDDLEIYFDGLMTNVGRARELLDKKVKTNAASHPLMGVKGWAQAYGVEVRTWNAFSKGEPLLLWGEVAQRDCGERMQIFLALSKAPRDHAIWEKLRAVRDATSCGGSGS
jgi:hypothetical protein